MGTTNGRGTKPPLKAVDLFCGAGGLSLGLNLAGFDVVRAYDIWQPAIDIYHRNVGPEGVALDLTRIYEIAQELRELDINVLAGGAPCQDYSPAGKREEGARAGLTHALSLLAQHLRPEWVFLENVAAARKAVAWCDMRTRLSASGYGITEMVIDCSLYGVPQKRQRLILIARLGEKDRFLDGAIRKAASETPMVLRDALGDLCPDYVYHHARMPERRRVLSGDEPHPTVRSVVRPAPKCANKCFDFIGGRKDARTTFACDSALPTVCQKSGEGRGPRHKCRRHRLDPIPPCQARVLTRDEIALVQGFPEWWNWTGISLSDRDMMVGNAVPPPVAEVLGRLIIDRHSARDLPEVPGGFRKWLARGGISAPAIRNMTYRIGRARRWLGGRTYRHHHDEVAALEATPQFMLIPVSERSNIRTALKRFAEWQALSPQNARAGYRSRVLLKGRRTTGRKR